MTRAPGWRSATERGTRCWAYGPSPVNEATRPAIWSSKGPTCELSSTSLVVSSDATIRPVSASTPIWSLRQDRRTLVPCFSISHSPGPQSFRPVLSTSRCTGLAVATKGLWLRRRLDGVGAEPATVGLLRTSGGQQSVKSGSAQPIVPPTPKFATSPKAMAAVGERGHAVRIAQFGQPYRRRDNALICHVLPP